MTAAPAEADTGLFVYGVVPARPGVVPADLVGLDQSAVRSVPHGDVAAVVGEITLDRPPGRRRELVAYSQVLDALAASSPVVPVQFGSIMLDEESVISELLAPNEDHFSALLEELTGRLQLNLRASYHEHVILAEVVAADPEIADLREMTRGLPEEVAYGDRVRLGELVARALADKRERDAAVLLDMILPHASAHVVREGSGVDHLLDAAFLVPADGLSDFEDALEDIAEAVHERIRLRLVGPMAAYDFVGGR